MLRQLFLLAIAVSTIMGMPPSETAYAQTSTAVFGKDPKDPPSKDAEKLMKEKIAIYEQSSAAFDKINSEQELKDATPKIKMLNERLNAIDKTWKDLEPEMTKVVLKKYGEELEKAKIKDAVSKSKAVKRVFKEKVDPK